MPVAPLLKVLNVVVTAALAVMVIAIFTNGWGHDLTRGAAFVAGLGAVSVVIAVGPRGNEVAIDTSHWPPAKRTAFWLAASVAAIAAVTSTLAVVFDRELINAITIVTGPVLALGLVAMLFVKGPTPYGAAPRDERQSSHH